MKDFALDAKQNAAALSENTTTAKKLKRRVHLYFDENDNMVEREEDEDAEAQDLKKGKADPNLDID